jgi:hypothetical protein
MTDYKPGTYVKGDQARQADTASDAVAAVFDGFKLQEDPEAPADGTPEQPEGQDVDPGVGSEQHQF